MSKISKAKVPCVSLPSKCTRTAKKYPPLHHDFLCDTILRKAARHGGFLLPFNSNIPVFRPVCPPYILLQDLWFLQKEAVSWLIHGETLQSECLHCHGCALAQTRTHVVFGDGSRQAKILLIGEGPGQHEDEQGIPFVGKAGMLLDDMLEIIGLDREKVYIANIVKCRPPHNRDPLNVEQDACIGYLRNQVALIRPKIIVCLGRIAAMRLIKPDFKITKEHGQWFEKSGVQMMALFHPAAILRDPRRRPETFEDLKKAPGQDPGAVHPHLLRTPRRRARTLRGFSKIWSGRRKLSKKRLCRFFEKDAVCRAQGLSAAGGQTPHLQPEKCFP